MLHVTVGSVALAGSTLALRLMLPPTSNVADEGVTETLVTGILEGLLDPGLGSGVLLDLEQAIIVATNMQTTNKALKKYFISKLFFTNNAISSNLTF